MLNDIHYYTNEDGENINIRQEIDEPASGGEIHDIIGISEFISESLRITVDMNMNDFISAVSKGARLKTTIDYGDGDAIGDLWYYLMMAGQLPNGNNIVMMATFTQVGDGIPTIITGVESNGQMIFAGAGL